MWDLDTINRLNALKTEQPKEQPPTELAKKLIDMCGGSKDTAEEVLSAVA